MFCVDESGEDVAVKTEEGEDATSDEDEGGESEGKNCHFHAGVE